MKMKPPHLPRKIHSSRRRRRGDGVLWFIACAFIGFLAGTAATLVSVAWIVPVYSPNTVVYSVDASKREQSDPVVDPLFVQQQEKQIVSVYDSREKNNQKFYTPEGYLGPGVFLTSDGWFVFHYPDYSAGKEKFLEVVDHKGNIYRATRAVFDPLTDLLYVKTNGDGFVSASFSNHTAAEEGMFLWSVYSDDWNPSVLGSFERNAIYGEHPIWEPLHEFSLTNQNSGSILLEENGSFLGFVSAEGALTPSFFIENQYRSIFESSKISYSGLNVKGYFVDGTAGADGWVDVFGFYVSNSSKRPSDTAVGTGDLITHIEGLPIDEEVLFQYILSSGDNITVSVLRKGEKIDILAPKENILLR